MSGSFLNLADATTTITTGVFYSSFSRGKCIRMDGWVFWLFENGVRERERVSKCGRGSTQLTGIYRSTILLYTAGTS